MMSEDSRNELLENLEQLRSKKHNVDCDLEFADTAMESLIEMTDQELDTAVESAKQAEVDAYLKILQWDSKTSDEVKTLVAGNIRGFAFRETTPQSPINQFISQLAVNFGELKKRLDHSAAENAQLREKLAAVEEKRDMWLRIAQRLFKERQTMLHGHVYDLPTDDVILEATILEAVIDGTEANETT